MLWEFLVLFVIALALFRWWAKEHYSFWEKRGIASDRPLPLLGSLQDVILRRQSFFDAAIDLYNRTDTKFYGVFDQREPLLLIKEPALIKQITIKDFDHFINHRPMLSKADENGLFGTSVFALKDAKWKDMRSTLSPTFTGSKMRMMFQLMNQVAENSIVYLEQEMHADNRDGVDVDIKDYFTRFTNDIIASTAFGLQVNSFQQKDNEFYLMGKRVTKFTVWQNIKMLLFTNFSMLMKLLGLKLFDKKAIDYFMRLVLDAMQYRKDHNIHRPDMINMLMEARGMIETAKGQPHHEWTDIEIVAQCFVFFFAGFETTSLLMCFAAHELMENPEIQDKLLQEIEEVTESLDGQPLSYQALQAMKYMDMVVTETMRKWPPAVFLDRECDKDYVCEVDGQRIEIKKGESVWIPVAGIHRDPKYYPNPDVFDPERFSDENKDKIDPFAYLPFGLGPRNCIGSRFALLEAKAILFYLVRSFRLQAAKNTVVPLKLSSGGFNLVPKDGFWLKLVKRTAAESTPSSPR